VPDSHRVRLKPKMKVTPQIEKVLKREAKNHRLNMKQTKLLKKYRESRNVLVRIFTWNCQIHDISLKPFSGIKKKILEVELTPTHFFLREHVTLFWDNFHSQSKFLKPALQNREIASTVTRTVSFLPKQTPTPCVTEATPTALPSL